MTRAPAPDIAAVLAFLAQSGQPPIEAGTPDQARKAMRTFLVDLRGPEFAVAGVDSAADVVAGCPARIYRPADASGPLPVVAFFHGGGFMIGDLDTHDPLCRLLARDCEAVVVAIDYPLAPEHPFPGAVAAAVAATREVHGRLVGLGGDDRLAVAGDSAGGNLASVVAQQARDLGLAAQLLMYPKVDSGDDYPSLSENATGYFLETSTTDWFSQNYLGGSPAPAHRTDPRLAPLCGDLAGLAPAVVVTAGFDPLRDEGEAYAVALREAGVRVDAKRYDDQIHGFANMDHVAPSARAAVDDLLARFKAVLHA